MSRRDRYVYWGSQHTWGELAYKWSVQNQQTDDLPLPRGHGVAKILAEYEFALAPWWMSLAKPGGLKCGEHGYRLQCQWFCSKRLPCKCDPFLVQLRVASGAPQCCREYHDRTYQWVFSLFASSTLPCSVEGRQSIKIMFAVFFNLTHFIEGDRMQ